MVAVVYLQETYSTKEVAALHMELTLERQGVLTFYSHGTNHRSCGVLLLVRVDLGLHLKFPKIDIPMTFLS